jgi:putative oxidoreductase
MDSIDKLIERYAAYTMPVARIFLAAIFLMSGLMKIGNFSGTAGYMASQGMPLTELFLVGAIILEVFGGLSIMFGYYARTGAVLLVLFLIPATIVFHPVWANAAEQTNFMKNLSMLGALFMIASLGPGGYSLDARRGTE